MASKPSTIAKVWETKAGFKAAIIFTRQKFYCGYVGVPEGHSLHGLHYDSNSPYLAELTGKEEAGQRGLLSIICGAERMQSPVMVFDVHGSITFSDTWSNSTDAFAELKDDNWYFGYDCAHSGDGEFPDIDAEGNIVYDSWALSTQDHPKSLDFCIEQCESLAQQILDKTLPLLALEHKPE